MTVAADILSLEPGAWVELLEFDGSALGAGILRLHPYTQMAPIIWQGEEYSPAPFEMKGFEVTSSQQPAPKLTIANVDRAVTLLCAIFDDMVGAKITRKRTLGKYLDAVNFTGGNPTADPEEHLPDDVWYIERKVEETNEFVTFELTSGMNYLNAAIPARQIMTYCMSDYRGPECGYTGPAVATEDDTPTSDLLLDYCGKRVVSCKLRFGEDSPLPHGGCPAAGLNR